MIRKVYTLALAAVIAAGTLTSCRAELNGASGNHGKIADLRAKAEPYALDLPAWELNNLVSPIQHDGLKGNQCIDYSRLSDNIRTVLTKENFKVCPQVTVRFTEPPLLLVVSPRDRISYFGRVLLKPDLAEEEITHLERRIDNDKLSSLVIKLGGLSAAYPAIVSPNMPVKHIVNAAVEEWAHQYLTFRPLGFLYLLDSLGLRQDPSVITMNETLAGMIADEIGTRVYDEYYANTDAQKKKGGQAGFDFQAEMRKTRKTVDTYMADGAYQDAEKYMEERRLEFVRNGYPIRKLNQAYFAFHGIYGQDPGSANPIYKDLVELRKSSATLADFVSIVSVMTSYSDLVAHIRKSS
jgi:hypothetical protein